MSLVRSSSWPWRPYCRQPETLSFRKENSDQFLESKAIEAMEEEGYAERDDKDDVDGDESVEAVIRGVRLEGRIMFDPAGETSSVIVNESSDDIDKHCTENDEAALASGSDGVAMCVVDSRDPYADFRTSMEEMVDAAGGLRDNWDSLEELLFCYLRVNDRSNHGYILRAFVDLLLISSGTRRTTDEPSGRGCIWENADSSNICGVGQINVKDEDRHSPSSSPCSPLSFYTSSSSCCSSTDSLSTTPYHASVESLETEEENSFGDTVEKKVPKNMSDHEITVEGHKNLSSPSSDVV